MGRLKQVKIFDSIEKMPLYNWEEFQTGGKDFKWFYVNEKDRENERMCSPIRMSEAYFSIQDQYAKLIGEFDKFEEYKTLICAKMEAAAAYAEGDLIAMNWINRYTEELKELNKPKNEGVDIKEVRLDYAGHYGTAIDPLKTSVADYIRITKIVNKRNKKGVTNG